VTEFLPVSSDGHLRLIEHFTGIAEPLTRFDVMLHVATLVAVCLVLRKDIADLAGAPFRVASNLISRRYSVGESLKDPGFLAIVYIGVASVPTAYIGFTYGDRFEALAGSMEFLAWMFMANGAVLLMTRYISVPLPFKRLNKGYLGMNVLDAIVIGAAQGMSVLRGVSRSGTTISAAVMLGVDRETAARFSFLAAIPAIAGAAGYTWYKAETAEALAVQVEAASGAGVGAAASMGGVGAFPATQDWTLTLLGCVVAFLTGVIALKLLLRVVTRGRFHRFGWYTLFLGAVLMAWERLGGWDGFWE